MTVGELKEALTKYPEEWRVAVPDPTAEGETKTVFCAAGRVKEQDFPFGWITIE
jgi:hypothetical protein